MRMKKVMLRQLCHEAKQCWANRESIAENFFESLEVWLEKHYGTAEMLAIVIGGTGALIVLQYQNWMML